MVGENRVLLPDRLPICLSRSRKPRGEERLLTTLQNGDLLLVVFLRKGVPITEKAVKTELLPPLWKHHKRAAARPLEANP